ncbi:MAG: hypothetical protein ACREF1_14985, partial [Acetobacteraceae bacterium]
QWKDCLRLAQLPETAPEWASKCRAQAIGMMRQANAALRLLLRLQDARRKLEGDAAACDRLAWTEHCALGLMAEALEHLANLTILRRPRCRGTPKIRAICRRPRSRRNPVVPPQIPPGLGWSNPRPTTSPTPSDTPCSIPSGPR